MKKLAVIIVAAVATACVVAQDRPNRGPNGRGGAGAKPAGIAESGR